VLDRRASAWTQVASMGRRRASRHGQLESHRCRRSSVRKTEGDGLRGCAGRKKMHREKNGGRGPFVPDEFVVYGQTEGSAPASNWWGLAAYLVWRCGIECGGGVGEERGVARVLVRLWREWGKGATGSSARSWARSWKEGG
jgi:hypothetical protein